MTLKINIMKLRNLLTTGLMFTAILANAKNVTTITINNEITLIKIQAAVVGMFLALLIIGLVSLIKYVLIDERIKKQKDVLKRRIIFFASIILSPIIWYSLFAFVLSNQSMGRIGTYRIPADEPFLYNRLFSTLTTDAPAILAVSLVVFFILFAWLFTKFGKYKGYTVLMNNHKILGIIETNKKNK